MCCKMHKHGALLRIAVMYGWRRGSLLGVATPAHTDGVLSSRTLCPLLGIGRGGEGSLLGVARPAHTDVC